MNLIEQLGGYQRARECLNTPTARECIKNELRDALLQYRRENNIFESLDKVVLVGCGTTNVLLEIIDFKYTNDLYRVRVLSTGSLGPIHKDNIRHATPQEIAQGYRDE